MFIVLYRVVTLIRFKKRISDIKNSDKIINYQLLKNQKILFFSGIFVVIGSILVFILSYMANQSELYRDIFFSAIMCELGAIVFITYFTSKVYIIDEKYFIFSFQDSKLYIENIGDYKISDNGILTLKTKDYKVYMVGISNKNTMDKIKSLLDSKIK
jgi:uncharacterized protein YjfI (DUF2170 family)